MPLQSKGIILFQSLERLDFHREKLHVKKLRMQPKSRAKAASWNDGRVLRYSAS